MRDIVFEFQTGSGQHIRMIRGDITEEPVDVIVNAANERLAHGGGVAGAIVRGGGAIIQRESDGWVREHGPVPTGGAAITSAGSLPARYVIHAVGPVWGSGDEVAKLDSAVRSSLELAVEHQVSSLSLPAISSGIFGFPADLCAQVIIATVSDFLSSRPDASLQEVNLVLFGEEMASVFLQEAHRRLGSEHVSPCQKP